MCRYCGLVVILAALAVPCSARVASGTSVWGRMASAEQVWRVEVLATEVAAGSAAGATLVDATVRVERAIKGAAPEAGTDRVRYAVSHVADLGQTTLGAGERAIVFLSRRSGVLGFTDTEDDKLPASPIATAAAGPAASPAQGLMDELVDLIAYGPPDLGWDGMGARELAACREQALVPALRTLAAGSNGLARGAAYAALFGLRDATSLPGLLGFLRQPASDQATAEGQRRAARALSRTSDLLPNAAGYRSQTGTDFTMALRPLLTPPTPEDVRVVVARLHQRLLSPAGIQGLVTALDDPSEEVRTAAWHSLTFTLGEQAKTGSLAAPLEQPPGSTAEAVGAWKSWWETTGKAQYGAAP